jgi:hypothetical protein
MQINIECTSSKLNKKHHICTSINKCDSFDVDKTPDDGHLRPKNVVRRRNKSENSCIEDRIYCVLLKIFKCNRALKYYMDVYIHDWYHMIRFLYGFAQKFNSSDNETNLYVAGFRIYVLVLLFLFSYFIRQSGL